MLCHAKDHRQVVATKSWASRVNKLLRRQADRGTVFLDVYFCFSCLHFILKKWLPGPLQKHSWVFTKICLHYKSKPFVSQESQGSLSLPATGKAVIRRTLTGVSHLRREVRRPVAAEVLGHLLSSRPTSASLLSPGSAGPHSRPALRPSAARSRASPSADCRLAPRGVVFRSAAAGRLPGRRGRSARPPPPPRNRVPAPDRRGTPPSLT